MVIFLFSYLPVFVFGGVLTEIIFAIGFIQFIVVSCVKFKGSSKIGLFLGTYSLEFYLSHTMTPSIIELFYKGSESKGIDVYNIVIDELMVKTPTTVSSDMMAIEALKIMIDKNISVLPVVDDGNFVGTITINHITGAGIVL